MKQNFFNQVAFVLVIVLLSLNLATMHLNASSATTAKSSNPSSVQTTTRKKPQYKVIQMNTGFIVSFSDSDLQKVLAQNAAQGWEFVQLLEGHNLVVFRKMN